MAQAIHIDETYLTQTLVELVQIDSTNPSLTPGAAGEAAIGSHLAALMTALDLEVTTHTLAPGRVNVVGIRRGRGKGRSLLWNGHMDTVGVKGMAEPFSAAIRDGKLYGRGSQDMKASLAAMLAAVKALNDAEIDLAGDLLVTAVADEEYASIGMDDLVQHYTADAAIVTEPTDMALCRAHRGFMWYTIETTGRAAHGSRFREGVDAIMHMGRILAQLDVLEKELRARTPHPLAGPPSLHASLIEGGTELSVYPATCKLQIERRTIPGESIEQATAELQVILDEVMSEDPPCRRRYRHSLVVHRLASNADAPIVRTLARAMQRRLGKPPTHVGATFWTDAAVLADAGIDTVLLGPVGAGLHSAEEWVDLSSAQDLAGVLADTAVAFCGVAG